MTASPHYNDLREVPLISDDELVERVGALVHHALRRQLWIMFLDEDHHQLPVIMPSHLPRAPHSGDEAPLAEFLRSVADDAEAHTIVLTYERPGQVFLSDADRRWCRVLSAACELTGLPFRALLLCHDEGVRQLAPDDYA